MSSGFQRDSFLIQHEVYRSDPSKWNEESLFDGINFQFEYHWNDVCGVVRVVQAQKEEYVRNSSENYEALKVRLDALNLLNSAPDSSKLMATFWTYGEDRHRAPDVDDAPFPLYGVQPVESDSRFWFWEGKADADGLFRFFLCSPDGKLNSEGRTLGQITRTIPRSADEFPPFLHWQIHRAKIEFQSKNFNAAQGAFRNRWKIADSAERVTDLTELARMQANLLRDLATLDQSKNTAQVARWHLDSLAGDLGIPSVSRNLFSRAIDSAQSLSDSIDAERGYVEPAIRRLQLRLEQLRLEGDRKRQALLERLETREKERSELREIFSVALAFAGTFWGTMQTTAEFKTDNGIDFWWRWPVVWLMAGVALSGSLYAFHRHKPIQEEFGVDTERFRLACIRQRRMMFWVGGILLWSVASFAIAYAEALIKSSVSYPTAGVGLSPYLLALVFPVIAVIVFVMRKGQPSSAIPPAGNLTGTEGTATSGAVGQ